MKEKLSFVLTNGYSEFDSVVNVIGCIEDVEKVFGIEFAAGIEYEGDNKKLIFASDYLFTDKEDYFLEKYDGLVEPNYFKNKDTGKVHDLNISGCRLDVTYNDEYHYTGQEQFSNAKIVTKGYAYPKSNNKMKI